MLLTLIIQKNFLAVCCPTSHKHSVANAPSCKRQTKKNSKYYITQYCFCECLYAMPVDKFNFPWCPETMPVQKLCRSIIEPEWSTRVTGDLLYITLFFVFCLLLLLFICCVYNALCHHFKFILLHVCYSS